MFIPSSIKRIGSLSALNVNADVILVQRKPSVSQLVRILSNAR